MTPQMKKLIAGAFLSLAAAALSAPVVRVGAACGGPAAGAPTTGTPPAPGSLSFSSASYAVTEGAGSAKIRLKRVGGTDGEVVGKVTLTDVSTSPADYRFKPGVRDTSFNPGGSGPNDSVLQAALQPDGKIIISGFFTSYNRDPSAPDGIMRLNADGTRDTSFNPGGSGSDGLVGEVALQPDGKIVIAGSTSSYNGDAAAPDYVMRLNADGTRDASFNPGGSGANGFVAEAALQPDGTIVIGGNFTSYNEDPSAPDRLIRLNADGTRDASFNPGGSGANEFVSEVALQPDGKILIVGPFFTSYNEDSSAPHYVMRLDGDLFATWRDGDAAEKLIQLPVVDDGIPEGDETLTLTLSVVSGGATLGSPRSATLTIGPGNPIDDSQNFVRQHYYDFLSREPDPEGLAFWTNQMTNCGTTNLEVCRINVSAAFFLSIEFQQTGYFVIRAHKAAFGNSRQTPRYTVFLRDQWQIGEGLVVGQGDWQARLEQNRRRYLEEFVSRPEFVSEFPLGTRAADYVEKLFTNAGVTPTQAETDAAIAAYGAGDAAGRAAALKSVTDSDTVFTALYNPSFVLMQYYGYLRRNPDGAPDLNFSGYDFWLNKMNSFSQPGENVRDEAVALARVRRAEMVRAFISSDEYRKRFGP